MYKKIALFFVLLLPFSTQAMEFNGASLSPLWSFPFAGIILSIAILPLLAPKIWHNHFGKITVGWVFVFLAP